jgi:sulfonate transport system ATP-binding protein
MGIQLHTQHRMKAFGTQSVLRGIDLTIQPGEFISIVGKSGSGKSTLLRLIAGLETPDSGSIWINNQQLTGHNAHVRVMFQDARLLPWRRVIDNVALGLPKEGKDRAADVLKLVGLAHKLNSWPSVLSGGERQRVALARALVTHPPLLLLDEPLGALDALTRIEMQQLLETVWERENFSALLITHDVDEAVALGDRVLLIEDGYFGLDLPVDLPRSRDRGSAQFAALKGHILHRVLGRTAQPLSA